MSGGSYDYLYNKDFDGAESIFRYSFSLRKMKKDAIKFGKTEFGIELEELYSFLKKTETMICEKFKKLKPLMKAFEWWQSSDTSEEDFDKVFRHWEEKKNIMEDIKEWRNNYGFYDYIK